MLEFFCKELAIYFYVSSMLFWSLKYKSLLNLVSLGAHATDALLTDLWEFMWNRPPEDFFSLSNTVKKECMLEKIKRKQWLRFIHYVMKFKIADSADQNWVIFVWLLFSYVLVCANIENRFSVLHIWRRSFQITGARRKISNSYFATFFLTHSIYMFACFIETRVLDRY